MDVHATWEIEVDHFYTVRRFCFSPFNIGFQGIKWFCHFLGGIKLTSQLDKENLRPSPSVQEAERILRITGRCRVGIVFHWFSG